MSRIARIVLEGIPYHITQRGNARQQVFFEERDYILYLDLLRIYCEEARLSTWAYCLMPNHVHVIAVPQRGQAMAAAMGRTHADFARYYNLKRRAGGHVWQARYFSTPLDAGHLWRAMAYVERNPVRAGLVKRAEEWRWSSARVRLGLAEGDGLVDLARWRAEYSSARWRTVLETSVEEEAFGERLREASRRGRPLGNDGFTEELERRSGRRLRPFPVGRPRKREQDENGQLRVGVGV